MMQITPFRVRLFLLLALAFCDGMPERLHAGEWPGYAQSGARALPHISSSDPLYAYRDDDYLQIAPEQHSEIYNCRELTTRPKAPLT